MLTGEPRLFIILSMSSMMPIFFRISRLFLNSSSETWERNPKNSPRTYENKDTSVQELQSTSILFRIKDEEKLEFDYLKPLILI